MKKKELMAALAWERTKNEALVHSVSLLLHKIDDMSDPGVPEISEVILNDPATVVKWSDGTKTVSKARGGDKWDPMFGIIACAVRKLTRNRGHGVSENEPLIAEMAKDIQSLSDIDEMTDFCLLTLDVLTILRDSADLWYGKLGPADDEAEKDGGVASDTSDPFYATSAQVAAASRVDELESRMEGIIAERERMRQKIRDLIDAGEL